MGFQIIFYTDFLKCNNIDAVLQQGCNLRLHDKGLLTQRAQIFAKWLNFQCGTLGNSGFLGLTSVEKWSAFLNVTLLVWFFWYHCAILKVLLRNSLCSGFGPQVTELQVNNFLNFYNTLYHGWKYPNETRLYHAMPLHSISSIFETKFCKYPEKGSFFNPQDSQHKG